jgi:tetratricopeptide (TPR) repeat protein
MARKKKSRAKQAKAQSPKDLARTADEHLAQNRYKDAVSVYKQLLKEEQRPKWREALASAYAGRAAQLAERDMIKEAIALWQNRAEICAKPVADPRYLQWLIAAGRSAEIARLYTQDAAALAGDEGVAALRARLAAAALADGGELVRQLPADDPVVRDFTPANKALTAYGDGDDEAVHAALGQIAFRSPYRDFRQLMKALLRYEQAPSTASELTARIPADTPFMGIMKALEMVGTTRSAAPLDSKALGELNAGAQDLLTALAGWNPAQEQLLKPLAELGTQAKPQALFDFVLNHRKALGEEYARVASYVLAGDDERKRRRLSKAYRGLSSAESHRLEALGCESDGDTGEALAYWHDLLGVLNAQPARDSDESLRLALVHRHIAQLLEPRSESLPLQFHTLEHLETSLEHDPADRDSLLKLLAHNLHVGDLKEARHWVDQALAQFPDDPDCLFRAAETAVAGQAFKKAARYAERILATDSINAGARGLLVDAYLGHARKQIRAGKLEAARREVNNAAGYARSAVDSARVGLADALVTFAGDGPKVGAALAGAAERAGDPLVGRFLLLLEAGRAGQDLAAVERAAGQPAGKALGTREHVFALVDTLASLRADQQHKPSIEAALNKLAPTFNQVAQTRLDRGRAVQVCEILLRYRQYKPLKRYALAALKRWKGDPLFEFYRVFGHKQGNRIRPFEKAFEHLNNACDRAYEAGDMHTFERIRSTLDDILPALREFAGPEPDPMPFDEDEIPNLPPKDMESILIEMADYFLGSDQARRLRKALKNGQPIPDDIVAKLQALGGGDELFPGPSPQSSGSGRKKERPRPTDDHQGDLFGDDL